MGHGCVYCSLGTGLAGGAVCMRCAPVGIGHILLTVLRWCGVVSCAHVVSGCVLHSHLWYGRLGLLRYCTVQCGGEGIQGGRL